MLETLNLILLRVHFRLSLCIYLTTQEQRGGWCHPFLVPALTPPHGLLPLLPFVLSHPCHLSLAKAILSTLVSVRCVLATTVTPE